MHLEFLVEDSSGAALLGILIPKVVGEHGAPHTWRIHAYKGIGRLPRSGLRGGSDPARRILLAELPRLLSGLAKTPGIDAIIVVLDADRRECRHFLGELRDVAENCGAGEQTLFRLAIEEMEAWYFGDRAALLAAYPRAKMRILEAYVQDGVCGTWETLADVVVTGGRKAVERERGPNAGDLKHEWARKIGPRMTPDANLSPSFLKFRDGLRRVAPSSNG